MKLLFCPACSDILRLFSDTRYCRCQASWGRYLDEEQAEIGGQALAVGIANVDFLRAFRRRDEDWTQAPEASAFRAWFMHPDAPHVTRAKGRP